MEGQQEDRQAKASRRWPQTSKIVKATWGSLGLSDMRHEI